MKTNDRTDADWHARVAAIADVKLRSAVASIAWWDYFATRRADKPNPLAEFVDEYDYAVDVPPAKIVRELVKLGYARKTARAKVKA